MTKKLLSEITPEFIASFFETSVQEMWRFARNTDQHYLPTRKMVVNGKEREFDVPKPYLKGFQKKLHKLLKNLDLFHHSAHGGIPKHSPQTSASRHCGNKHDFTRDIKGCFPSTTPDMLLNELVKAGFPKDTALLFSKLLTVRGRVPQGACTSMDAINLLFIRMDRAMHQLCRERNFVYTRYVDDCTVSGNDFEDGKYLIKAVEEEIESIGLTVNHAKSKTLTAGCQKQKVQGLLVHRPSGTMIDSEKKQVALGIAREFLHKCRHLTQESIQEAASLRRLLCGHCSYFSSATFSIAKHLKRQLRDGDRIALNRLKTLALACDDGKWWRDSSRQSRTK